MLESMKRKIRRYRRSGRLRSGALFFDAKTRRYRDRYHTLLKRSTSQIIRKHVSDNMKAPGSNGGKMAFLTKASFNIYFGDNLAEKNEEESSGKTLLRTAYGAGSGVGSIGLDPRKATIFHMFPDLSELRNIVRNKLKAHYKENENFVNVNCDFNHVSVKLYFNNKETGEHTDIEFDCDHNPKVNNSQVPGTPVAIAMIGDTKLLNFHEYKMNLKNKTTLPTGETVTFLQESGMLLLLDWRDEFLNKKNCFWTHSSKMTGGKDSVAMTLMFRVVCAEREVYARNGEYVDKTVWGTGKKEAQLDAAWKALENNMDKYNKKCKEIRTKLNNLLIDYCS